MSRSDYRPYIRSLYDYLDIRVKNELTLLNAHRIIDDLPKVKLSEAELEEVIVQVLNHIHVTDEFNEVILGILSEKAGVGSNG